ncbi:hypothetical protein ABZ313_42225 [Streptomyces sp. NPDC006251]|uniref:hypothetical protein n=1 Tax=Streptomyces sp. NPDC006251 TaxID=3155718 RepID=UPI0033A88BA7
MATKNHSSFAAGSSESGYGSNGAVQRMNRDWEVLGRDLRAADHVAAWAAQHPEFDGVAVPQDVIDRLTAFRRSGDWDGHDRALTVLLERATAETFDGQLAWRIVVRALLPKAISIARTQMHSAIDWDDLFSTVLSCLFEVVRTYPVTRRPHAIFANLSMDTLSLAQTTLAADFDSRGELRRIAASVSPLAGDRHIRVMPPAVEDPHVQAALAELLARAAELELVGEDEPELTADDPRAALLDLVLWAVDADALKVSDAQRITDYYLASSDEPGRPIRTTRAMGAEGARLRQRASRAVRPLRCADLDAYYMAAA